MGRTEKFRGRRTHGRGHKAGRGAGKRGGKGNAGSNKHRVIRMHLDNPDYFGMHGFKRPQSVVSANTVVNVSWLRENLGNPEVADPSGDVPVFNLANLGVDKLLGGGRIDAPVKVIVDDCSARAREKVEAAGGEIINPEGIDEEA